jgi:hypothetical protein
MVHKRRIVVYIATGADGFIARSEGSVDWLARARPKGNYGMSAFYKSIDTILWGKNTCDMARDCQKKGVAGSGFDTRVKNYVFTRSVLQSAAPSGVEFVNEPIKAFAMRLREKTGERHLHDGWRWHHCIVSRRRRDRRVHDSYHSRVYMRRHSIDRSPPSHCATKIDLFHEVHRRYGQAAPCGRQVILVPVGCGQTLNS